LPSDPSVELSVGTKAAEVVGIAPFTSEFSMWSQAPVETAILETGVGRYEVKGNRPEGRRETYQHPGLYVATFNVDRTHEVHAIVRVYERKELDAILQKRWATMRDALRHGDVDRAVGQFTADERASYRTMFNALTIPVADFGRRLGGITFHSLSGPRADYNMTASNDGVQSSETVVFELDHDGIWRLRFL